MNQAQLNAMANRFKPAIAVKPVVKLDKCEYSIFIHTELTRLFSGEDFWSFLKSQPLKILKEHEKEATKALENEDESNIYLQMLNKGTVDYQTFSMEFYKAYPKDYCKEGFGDLTSMAFVKYNEASLFSQIRAKRAEDIKTPCAAFEDNTICSELPVSHSMQDFVGLLNYDKVTGTIGGREMEAEL